MNGVAQTAGEEFWERHYRAASPLSGGRPSAALVQFAGTLPPGQALDLGCSRGDDALWLAGRGWHVLGVDISAAVLGYAAENPDELKVVVDPFSEERYGVGYSLDKPEMCQWIVDTLTAAQDDGTWGEAFEATLGQSGVETPEPPAMDECPAA